MAHTFQPGDKVSCTYRIPTAHQWWIAPVHVGTVEHPSPADAAYCNLTGSVVVRYPWGLAMERGECLFPAMYSQTYHLNSGVEAVELHRRAQQTV